MRAVLSLVLATLGCAPGLERIPDEPWVESDVFLSPQEQWDLSWKRYLPEIQAAPPPERPPEFAAPALAAAWRKGLSRGRDWALAEGMRFSNVCAFPRTDLDRAASAGFDAGRSSIRAWYGRIRDESLVVLMTIRRPSDPGFRGTVPVILCFSRDIEAAYMTAAREARRAAVGLVFSDDYSGLSRRPDLLQALLTKGLDPARPGALHLVATSEAREALKDMDLPHAWRSPEPIQGESDSAYLERAFRSLP